jgi:hypothetical protein
MFFSLPAIFLFRHFPILIYLIHTNNYSKIYHAPKNGSHGSVVSTVGRLDDPGFNSWHRQTVFLFRESSIEAVGSTKYSTWCVPGPDICSFVAILRRG